MTASTCALIVPETSTQSSNLLVRQVLYNISGYVLSRLHAEAIRKNGRSIAAICTSFVRAHNLGRIIATERGMPLEIIKRSDRGSLKYPSEE